jgi:hypothetical protein
MINEAQNSTNKRKAGVRFDLANTPEKSDYKKSKAEANGNNDQDLPIALSSATCEQMMGMIGSLCPDIFLQMCSKSILPNPLTAMTFFGLLSEIDSYRHALYRRETPSTFIRISLRETIKLVSSMTTTKSLAWPLLRRYKLAYILARSILTYSRCWFKSNWRCDDIVLVAPSK